MFREIEVLSLSGVDPSWVVSLIETQQGQDTKLCPARCHVQMALAVLHPIQRPADQKEPAIFFLNCNIDQSLNHVLPVGHDTAKCVTERQF